MAEPTVIPPGGGELIGDAPDRRVEILCEHDALHATWSRFGPGRDGADLHIHRDHTDLFYVLAGELTVRLGIEGEEIAVPAGRLVRVPPMVVHGFRNAARRRAALPQPPRAGRGLRRLHARAARREPRPVRPGGPARGRPPAGDARRSIGDAARVDTTRSRSRRLAGPAAGSGTIASRLRSTCSRASSTLATGGRELRAPAGSWVQVPPGEAPALSSDGRYLRISL